MKTGFYWGSLPAEMKELVGERFGVVFVKDGSGYMSGLCFKESVFEFGPNPEPIEIPEWVVIEKRKEQSK